MKKVVIVVGSHHVGKSVTINTHLKPLLAITEKAYLFTLNQQLGKVLSQTLEEKSYGRPSDVEGYFKYDLLVIAARPDGETPSYLNEVRDLFLQAGYRVDEVLISKGNNGARDAQEIFDLLSS